jgi:hypothetical protein
MFKQESNMPELDQILIIAQKTEENPNITMVKIQTIVRS